MPQVTNSVPAYAEALPGPPGTARREFRIDPALIHYLADSEVVDQIEHEEASTMLQGGKGPQKTVDPTNLSVYIHECHPSRAD
jgi:hypothetical protein